MKDFFSSFHKVPEPVLDEYIANWSNYKVSKKSIITESGHTERYLYYIKEGIQKSYYEDNGKQHIMFFAYPPSLSGIVESFLTQTPAKSTLEAVTDSSFLRIPYYKHLQLIEEHRELETLFRKITEHFLLGIIERHRELMAYNVEKRFRNFFKRSPHLINMVPQKDISSYLRIDPTNFSKLINSITI